MALPKGFIPTEDPGYILFNISAPPGSTREQMERSATELNDLLMKQPDAEDVFISIGSGGAGGQAAAANGGGGGSGMTSGSATLVMRDGHKMHTEELKQHHPSAAQTDRRHSRHRAHDGRRPDGLRRQHPAHQRGRRGARQGAARPSQRDEGSRSIRNPRLSPEPPGPELIIRPRTDEAARLNVSTDAIAQVARIATSGDIEANTPKFSEGERRLAIRVRLPDDVRNDLAQLAQLRVPTLNGGSTTLGAVADALLRGGPWRDPAPVSQAHGVRSGRLRAGRHLGRCDRGDRQHQDDEGDPRRREGGQRRRLARPHWPGAGDDEMFGGIVIALLAGIALIYSVMVLLFKSVFKPLVILASLPLSFSGAFFALLISGKEISMPVMIGCVLLLGIAAKNAILLVEFAIEAQQRGKNTYDALFEACRERARPIVMTTVAMSAGMIPTALGLGEGAGFRTPMAVAVIGGLISSTVLSLILVPVRLLASSTSSSAGSVPGPARLATKPTAEDESSSLQRPQHTRTLDARRRQRRPNTPAADGNENQAARSRAQARNPSELVSPASARFASPARDAQIRPTNSPFMRGSRNSVRPSTTAAIRKKADQAASASCVANRKNSGRDDMADQQDRRPCRRVVRADVARRARRTEGSSAGRRYPASSLPRPQAGQRRRRPRRTASQVSRLGSVDASFMRQCCASRRAAGRAGAWSHATSASASVSPLRSSTNCRPAAPRVCQTT